MTTESPRTSLRTTEALRMTTESLHTTESLRATEALRMGYAKGKNLGMLNMAYCMSTVSVFSMHGWDWRRWTVIVLAVVFVFAHVWYDLRFDKLVAKTAQEKE